MNQPKQPPKNKRMPAYSNDSMMVHFISGLMLIALGVLMFLSVAVQMQGDVFAGLKNVCRGLAGAMAILLPIVPIWGGVLVIMSTQRKAPIYPYVWGMILFLELLGCAGLLTFISTSPARSLLDYLVVSKGGVRTWDFFFQQGWTCGAQWNIGGGLLGMIFAWPLWSLVGPVGGGILCILLMVVSFLFLIRFDVKKAIAFVQNKREEAKQEDAKQQESLRQHELQWQQAQARRAQEEAAARQQAWQGTPPYQQAGYGPQNYQYQSGQSPVYDYNAPMHPETQPIDNQPIGFPPTKEETADQRPNRKHKEPLRNPRREARIEAERVGKTDRSRRKRIFDVDDPADIPPPVPQQAYQANAAYMPPQQKTEEEANQYAAYRPPEQQPAQQVETQSTSTAWTQPVQQVEMQAAFTDRVRPIQQAEPQTESATWTQPAQYVETQSASTAWTQPVQQVETQATSAAWTQPVQQVETQSIPTTWTQPVQQVETQSPSTTWTQSVQQEETQTVPKAATPWQQQISDRLSQTGESTKTETPRETGRQRRSTWTEDAEPARTSSWRTEEETPARHGIQKPKASWSDVDDLPPWEDSVTPPSAPVVPVMQQQAPSGVWKPTLDLAPTKEGAETLGGSFEEEKVEIPYVFPGLELLKEPNPQSGISPEEDALRAQRLEDTLASFRVTAKVRHVTHGPAISRFELELDRGIKVNKVTDLAQNIAMNMEVKSVRIEAPIPGKALVGIEVPNRKTQTVMLREILESEVMQNAKSPLTVALGKDIAGTPIVCDLVRMPHLLIAGATGSGKSVCINTMINSILYRCSPKDVRLILVDPKVVELQCYNGIPHLLIPVVSDPHKAAGALAWAVAEMMDRYKKFQIKGVRAIDGYNASLDEGEEHMPRIVIIIDELADLMMTCKREVEEYICRLAQLARAAGIHLVVATQRPSVDVITGLIKANIPSRIAFKVSSFIDSRTILDKMGAEQLLGWGDMLYQPTGEFTPIRIQGCFLSDNEVNGITDFVRANSPSQYDPNVMEELERLTEGSDGMPDMTEINDTTAGGDGSLLAQCIEMAVNDGQVSTSLIQRRLKVGYARAGRLVDEMEKRGIVSAKDGAKPRMCLISREEYERMKESGELEA